MRSLVMPCPHEHLGSLRKLRVSLAVDVAKDGPVSHAMNAQQVRHGGSEKTIQVVEDNHVDQGSLWCGRRVGPSANEPVGFSERH
jgi:hypothetical protein